MIPSNESSAGTTMFERHGTMLNGNRPSPIYHCPILVGCEKISKLAFCKATESVRTMRAKHMKESAIIDDKVYSFAGTAMNARKFNESEHMSRSDYETGGQHFQTVQHCWSIGTSKARCRKSVRCRWCIGRSQHNAIRVRKICSAIFQRSY